MTCPSCTEALRNPRADTFTNGCMSCEARALAVTRADLVEDYRGAVSSSSAQAGATSSLSGTLTAAGGAGGSGGSLSVEDFGRQNLYVLPAPVQAAPLPPGLCPQGDSVSVGILWNLFSFSQSSTRTEMQCLERVLDAIKPVAPVQTTLAPLTSAEKATLERLDRESRERAASSAASVPASTTPAPGAASAATKGKKVAAKKPAPKKADPVLPDCGADGVLQCKPKTRI